MDDSGKDEGRKLLVRTKDQASPKDQTVRFGREGNSEYTTGSWRIVEGKRICPAGPNKVNQSEDQRARRSFKVTAATKIKTKHCNAAVTLKGGSVTVKFTLNRKKRLHSRKRTKKTGKHQERERERINFNPKVPRLLETDGCILVFPLGKICHPSFLYLEVLMTLSHLSDTRQKKKRRLK